MTNTELADARALLAEIVAYNDRVLASRQTKEPRDTTRLEWYWRMPLSGEWVERARALVRD